MRSAGDIPIPKHFFVYAEERSENPWFTFRKMSLAWQGAIAAGVLLLGILAASAASRLNIRAENGALIIGFATPAPMRPTPVPMPVVDTAAIEARVLNALEEKKRVERLEWVRALRAEIDKSNRTMSERQRRILQVAMSELEARLGGQMTTAAKALEDRSGRALSDLYQVISSERERDLASINNRLGRLAVNNEAHSSQTDAILETLLQVAELKLK
jgi:hypothetical protein